MGHTQSHHPYHALSVSLAGDQTLRGLWPARVSTMEFSKISWLTEPIEFKVSIPRTEPLDITMKLGYARTSSSDDEDLQRNALAVAGADKIFVDRGVSAGTVFKPAWAEMLRAAKPGDEIIVCNLDRVASSLSTLLLELMLVERLGLSFRSMDDAIACEPGGAFFSHLRVLAGFSRRAALARTTDPTSMASPGRHTRQSGHQPQMSEEQWREYKAMMAPPKAVPVTDIARLAGVSRAAIYKRLKKDR
jgi:DNA invertase Pin-like site-specific DNA recombinase